MHLEAKLVLSSDPRFLPAVRHAMEGFAEALGWDESDARKITLALEEAVTNKIRHAYHNRDDGRVVLELATINGNMEFRLTDQGDAPDLAKICARERDSMRPGGFGTHIIRDVMDTVVYESSPQGNHLILTKRLPQSG